MKPSKPTSLWNKGFIALLITQFTVAFNDNAFRWLLIPIGKAYADGDFIRSLGSVFLLIPFLLWTSIAGYVTDRFNRRSVMIWCKLIELLLLAAAVGFIMMGPTVTGEDMTGQFSMPLKVVALLGILFLLGSQSAFFSPSKYSTIPDLVPESKLSAANGLVSMLTMAACVLGQVLGGYLFAWTTLFGEKTRETSTIVDRVATGIPGSDQIWLTALCLLGMAAIGCVSSFFIPKFKPVDPEAKFPRNPFKQTALDLATLFSHRRLFWIAMASAFFWGMGALAVANIDKFASDFLKVPQQHVTVLAAILSVGIGLGALVCGWLSGRKIELGLVPIGAFGMGFFILLLGFTPGHATEIGAGSASPLSLPYLFALTMMFMTGVLAGLYDIPLSAYIQHYSPFAMRGRLIAAYNFISFSMMLVFTGLFFAGAKLFHWINSAGILHYDPSLLIWIATGLLTIAISGILVYWLNPFFFIFIITTPIRWLYRPKVVGLENLPETGGALLVGNHTSLLDGLILYAVCPRNIRYFAHEGFVPKILEGVARETKLIKLLPGKKVIHALKEARQGLKDGDLIGVFPEGGITRNGQMRAFEPGFMSILKGAEESPIIPVHIHGLYESMFSYKYGDKKITLWPRRLPNNVIISFGKPIHKPEYPMQVQRAVQELGIDSYKKYNKKMLPIPARILIRTCRKRGGKLMFTDSTGAKLSGYKFLTATLILRRLLNQHVLKSRTEEPHVGILAPMSVGGCLLNAALCLDRRVPVDLNFTFGTEGINHCINQAGITHVMTSRKILDRYPDLKLDAQIVCTEDLMDKITTWMKVDCLLDATVLPQCILEFVLGLRNKKEHEALSTLIYTSGSTGKPKGVMLTNNNLAEVGRSFVDAMRLGPNDTVLGFLPFFHAFGFMGNFWLPLFCGGAGVFHFNPLEPKKVGEMSRKHPITFVASTPTFLRNFLRRCPKEDFEHAHTVMCGAEKVPVDLMDAWQEKYGSRPSEGFGATELSPLPTTNVPDSRVLDSYTIYRKDGSIGRAVANVMVKIVDLNTGEDLPPDQVGMIVVKGPIVMKGYYKQPELTAEVIKDGWYITGDVGRIDSDGFVWITGRQSRISKIGGEMIPHVLIEEEIQKIIADYRTENNESDTNDRNGPQLAVTAVPHPTKGEQIIVLYRDLPITPKEIVDAMIAKDLPRIWIPAVNGFWQTDEIPVLGTGKLDLAGLKRIACEMAEKQQKE